MSYGRLNIWARYSNCELITECWRQDLVIMTCGDKYLIDMDPTVIEQLRERYPDYEVTRNDEYPGQGDPDRIKIVPPSGTPLFHVEVDVPPGCYKVWTRVCRSPYNDETNKVMVIVDCGEEVCVNLLLDAVRACGREFLHPFLRQAVEMKLPAKDIQAAAKAIMDVAQKPEKDLFKELDVRVEEARLMKDKKLIEVADSVRKMFGGGMRKGR